MRVTTRDIQEMKARGEKIPVLTAYDYPSAKLLDEAGVPIILVGDSLAQVVLGYDSTLPVTMEEMLHHVRAVVRGAKRALVVADMPFMSYQVDASQALVNAGRFLQEGSAQAVKLEGGRRVAETVRRITQAGIPVMGHAGMTPQSVHQLGGYHVQGRDAKAAANLLADALALEEAGAFCVVLELVPAPLAKLLTQRLRVPTIGIGAGPDCDGQVQVYYDLLGLFTDFVPKHAKRYAAVAETIRAAVAAYVAEVQSGAFPTEKQSFTMDESALTGLLRPSPEGLRPHKREE
ncbi:MAG: 3-methyl-2-oxobutanoate hydroxymethyltransferase [Dehalococcoidia bacterium]|nr:3-methyl-2-oxobutanoate hydroxymethyltransferase [Dehalococcoidia bacterium]